MKIKKVKSYALSKKRLESIILTFTLSVTSSFAADINVPADQPTIADAVSNANAGDVIIIAPGTYVEQSEIIIDKQLTITSHWHTTDDTDFIRETVLDGVNKSNTLFQTRENRGVNVEISGLTFTRFRKPIVLNDTAVIKNNVFTNNDSDSISFESKGSGYAGYNTIEDSGDDGIDVDTIDGTLITLEFNTIRNNGDEGIEIRLMDGAQSSITYDIHDNILKGNDEDGIQLIDHASNDSGRLFNIYNNVLDGNAQAGLGCMSGGNTNEDFSGADMLERVNFYNNTVINNAVGVTGGDNFIALNNIIANNTNEGIKRLRKDSVVAHSIFFNNGTHTVDTITDTGIKLDVDPKYDLQSYQLLSGSSSIDGGVAVFDWNGEQVLNRDSAEFAGTAPDLGAKESGIEGGGGSEGGEGTNTSPIVNAGNNQVTLDPSSSIVLQGQVSDDGLPISPGEVTATWTQDDGPGVVTFIDETDPTTTASFSQQGKYQLRLRGDDGELTASDSVVVRYANGGSGNTVSIQTPGDTYFEAEDYAYLYGTAQEINDSNASGDATIEATDGFGIDAFSEHTLVVTDQNVTFNLWILGKGIDESSDSILVTFENSPEIEVTLSSDDTYNWFKVPGGFTTSAGSWPLIIRAGEDGVIWDRILFTTDLDFVPRINQAPTVSAGSNQTITLPNAATLNGTVSDDGLPNQPGTVTTAWSKVSGPGTVSFGDTNTVDTTANFSANGTYVLQLNADDSALTTSDEVTITVSSQPVTNQAPTVTAGSNQTITLPNVASLSGTVSDDGLPNQPGSVTTTWSKVSGPGTVSFGDVNVVETTASFSVNGTYVLKLNANDGALANSDEVTITVNSQPVANQAPIVAAGSDQTINLPNSVTLNGAVSDDGLPSQPGSVTTTWSKVSGPGTVSFDDENAVDTTADFSATGTYVLQLSADDSVLTTNDRITVTVDSAPIEPPSENNFGLGISSNSNRSGAEDLDGAVASGRVCIFLTPVLSQDIDSVSFWLDGRYVKTEMLVPYDLTGTYSDLSCGKLNTRWYRNGSHTVDAEITLDSGETISVSADFRISN